MSAVVQAGAGQGWRARLTLHYRMAQGRCVALDRHEGPLRVLQRLYPEGPAICHHVLVHPPGGIVGGDQLAMEATLAEGCHALVTTPGATRFYRSAGATARQQATLTLAPGARLEWLPLESIAFDGCRAENAVRLDLAPGAEMIGWDVLALGLPAAGGSFGDGAFQQHLDWPGVWLERGEVRGGDTRLLDSPLGWAGHRVLGTLWFAAGSPMAATRIEALLGAAREAIDTQVLDAGATSPEPRLVLLRVLGPQVEPVMQLLQATWSAWRAAAWALPPVRPRSWGA